jgi:inhibitor of KinA sporulation pathway (predicted exonuclease)
VRPVVNPTLTVFCTELTGIQQSWVDEAPTFEAVLRQHTHALVAATRAGSSAWHPGPQLGVCQLWRQGSKDDAA